MPSSDPVTIPKILKLIEALGPGSILDIGCGNGRFGFLFREILDWNYGRLDPDAWEVRIDAIEMEQSYLTPVHQYVYNNVYPGDWMFLIPPEKYDLVFMGDVLEHFQEGIWQEALSKATEHGDTVIVVSPNWDGSCAQGAWMGHESERHRSELTPAKVGGKCVFANSKCFINVLGDPSLFGTPWERRDILL